jgi:hypothetical protein
MQVACENYPDGQCTNDVGKNVEAGATFIRKQLDATNNSAIATFGNYNGWFTAADANGLNGGMGLTESYACSAQSRQNGGPQNLDYLQQVLNGWILGLDPQGADLWIGEYQCKQCSGGALC